MGKPMYNETTPLLQAHHGRASPPRTTIDPIPPRPKTPHPDAPYLTPATYPRADSAKKSLARPKLKIVALMLRLRPKHQHDGTPPPFTTEGKHIRSPPFTPVDAGEKDVPPWDLSASTDAAARQRAAQRALGRSPDRLHPSGPPVYTEPERKANTTKERREKREKREQRRRKRAALEGWVETGNWPRSASW